MLLYRVRLRPRAVQELFAIAGIAIGVGAAVRIPDRQHEPGRLGAAAGATASWATCASSSSRAVPRASKSGCSAMCSAFPACDRRCRCWKSTPRDRRRRAAVGPAAEHRSAACAPRRTAAAALHRHSARPPGGLRAAAADRTGDRDCRRWSRPSCRSALAIVPSFLGAVLLERDIGGLDRQLDRDRAACLRAAADGHAGSRDEHLRRSPRPGREQAVRAWPGTPCAADVSPSGRPTPRRRSFITPRSRPISRPCCSPRSARWSGFLFAFNAMLLTVPQRRSLVEDLRLDGYARSMIVEVLLFDALVLGLVASLLGLLLGDLLSLLLFSRIPAISPTRSRSARSESSPGRACRSRSAWGLLTACIGVLVPLRADIVSSLSPRASGGRLRHRTHRRHAGRGGGLPGDHHRDPAGRPAGRDRRHRIAARRHPAAPAGVGPRSGPRLRLRCSASAEARRRISRSSSCDPSRIGLARWRSPPPGRSRCSAASRWRERRGTSKTASTSARAASTPTLRCGSARAMTSTRSRPRRSPTPARARSRAFPGSPPSGSTAAVFSTGVSGASGCRRRLRAMRTCCPKSQLAGGNFVLAVKRLARRRVGGALAGARRRTPSADRRVVHAARAAADALARRGAERELRLAVRQRSS